MKYISLASLLGLCLFMSCSKNEETHLDPEKYAVTQPITLDTAYTKEYVCQIRSLKNIEIRAMERGFLQNIYVDEGQSVGANQLLFQIKPTMYQAEFEKSKAESKAAEIELQNTKILAEKNIVSPNEQAVAKARLDQAKAAQNMANFHLSATQVKAPFAGIIDRLPMRLGSLVDEGELLTSLSDNSEMFAYFNVSEPEYIDYMTNKNNGHQETVKLLLANNQTLKYDGKVEVVEGEFDNETGNIAFRAKFPNPERLLRHGETGKILMRVPVHNALIIPQKATYEIQDKKYVFVVDSQNKVHSKEITISGELPDLYIVSGGISAKDTILLEGVQRVNDNDKIVSQKKNPLEVIQNLKLKAE